MARSAHALHRVKLFTPALCRVRQGTKTVQWGEYCEVASTESLILFPGGAEIDIANTPHQGKYVSDMVYIPNGLLQQFKEKNPKPSTPVESASLCIPFHGDLKWMWNGLIESLKSNAPQRLQEHQLEGVLLALHLSGNSGLFFQDRYDPLSVQVQQILLLDLTKDWTVDEVAARLHMGSSTFRRRLNSEEQSFRKILENVRMGKALYELQSSHRTIGGIAYRNGYTSASRFSARFTKHFGITPSELRDAMRKEKISE